MLVLTSGYTLKAEPTGFVVELDMSCETRMFDIETGRLGDDVGKTRSQSWFEEKGTSLFLKYVKFDVHNRNMINQDRLG